VTHHVHPLPTTIIVSATRAEGGGEYPLRARLREAGEVPFVEGETVYVREDEVDRRLAQNAQRRIAHAARERKGTLPVSSESEADVPEADVREDKRTQVERMRIRAELLRELASELLGPRGDVRELRLQSGDLLAAYGQKLDARASVTEARAHLLGAALPPKDEAP